MIVDFNKDGWSSDYLALREEYPFSIDALQRRCGMWFSNSGIARPELMIYLLLQGTGILYGYPIKTPAGVPREKTAHIIKHKFQAKFIFLDCLFTSVMLSRIVKQGDTIDSNLVEIGQAWRKPEIYKQHLHEAAGLIFQYFCGTITNPSNKKFESAFKKRIRYQNKFYEKSIAGINSLLFWDISLVLAYVRIAEKDKEAGRHYLQTVNQRRKTLKELSMQVILAAIHSDGIIEKEELALFSQFLNSPGLSRLQKIRLESGLKNGATVSDLNIPELDLIARRFLLDLGLLSVYSDRSLADDEFEFLRELTGRLSLSESDLEQSEAALGAFLVRYGKRIPFLRSGKTAAKLISHAVAKNTKKLLGAVKAEGKETKDMAIIFGKVLRKKLRLSKRKDLPDPEEIRAALEQLKDIPKFAPFFGIAFMPLPGVTELYLVMAVAVEKMSANKVKLLPSNFSKMMKKNKATLE